MYAMAMDDLFCRPVPRIIVDLARLVHVFIMGSLSERGYPTSSVYIILTVVTMMWKEMGGTSVMPPIALTPHRVTILRHTRD